MLQKSLGKRMSGIFMASLELKNQDDLGSCREHTTGISRQPPRHNKTYKQPEQRRRQRRTLKNMQQKTLLYSVWERKNGLLAPLYDMKGMNCVCRGLKRMLLTRTSMIRSQSESYGEHRILVGLEHSTPDPKCPEPETVNSNPNKLKPKP